MNIESTANGAYLASLLACLPNIERVSVHQDLNLHAMSFDEDGSPSGLNAFSSRIAHLYKLIQQLHDSYFPGAAAAFKARSKLRKYNKVIAALKEIVPFVIEAQGRWGFPASEIFM